MPGVNGGPGCRSRSGRTPTETRGSWHLPCVAGPYAADCPTGRLVPRVSQGCCSAAPRRRRMRGHSRSVPSPRENELPFEYVMPPRMTRLATVWLQRAGADSNLLLDVSPDRVHDVLRHGPGGERVENLLDLVTLEHQLRHRAGVEAGTD